MLTDRVNPHLTAKIVRGNVRHHRLEPDQLSDLITSVHRAIGQLGQPDQPEEVRTPAVYRPDLICVVPAGADHGRGWASPRRAVPLPEKL
jgi:predicted transcriptional regulator